MDERLKEKVLLAYMEGLPVFLIAEGYLVTQEEVTTVLHTYRDENRLKRAFSDDFRKMIAERDLNGVARSNIAKELGININTVKKSCEEFGQSSKEGAVSDRMFTRIAGQFSKETCVNCGSKHYNEVEEETYYCMSCNNEFIYEEDAVLQVNFEYLD